MAANSNTIRETGCCSSEMAKKYTRHILENKVINEKVRKRNGQRRLVNTISERSYWPYDKNGSSTHSTASTLLGGSRLQERTRSAERKLERCYQEGPTKNGKKLSWQLSTEKMASNCGRMRSYGCGMNQSRGQKVLSS